MRQCVFDCCCRMVAPVALTSHQHARSRARTCPHAPRPHQTNPTGQYLLQSCLNSKMRLVSYSSGCIVKTYKGHANTKFCCISTFLPGLPHRPPAVASGSEDGAIFMWDVNSKQVCARGGGGQACTWRCRGGGAGGGGWRARQGGVCCRTAARVFTNHPCMLLPCAGAAAHTATQGADGCGRRALRRGAVRGSGGARRRAADGQRCARARLCRQDLVERGRDAGVRLLLHPSLGWSR